VSLNFKFSQNLPHTGQCVIALPVRCRFCNSIGFISRKIFRIKYLLHKADSPCNSRMLVCISFFCNLVSGTSVNATNVVVFYKTKSIILNIFQIIRTLLRVQSHPVIFLILISYNFNREFKKSFVLMFAHAHCTNLFYWNRKEGIDSAMNSTISQV